MGRVIKRAVVPEANLIKHINSEEAINTGKSKEITQRILQLMASNNWNQKELAENLQKSEAEISKLLSGTHNFTLRTIAKFEAVLKENIISVPTTITHFNGGKVVKMKARGFASQSLNDLNFNSKSIIRQAK